MEKHFELAYQLKEEMNKDPRFIALNEAENKMENDPEVIKLTYQKDMKENAYNDALRHYSHDSEEVKKAQHDLYIAKRDLESHPLVRDYLVKYQVVRLVIEEINKTLFSDLNVELCKKEK